MGTDFSHADAHWSYSGFHRFRARLATQIGILLDEMEGFGGERPWSEVKHPIKPLLNHSDCDGSLSPEECAYVAPALRAIVEEWPQGDYDRINGERLADGMEYSAEQDTPLEFC